ncbi:oxidoreductase [Aspergillus germanicus]
MLTPDALAASGIGKETALAFAEAGVEGTIIDECRKFSKHPKFRVVPVQTDVADEDSDTKMVEIAVKEFGRIDYCVHSAGRGNTSGARTEHLNIEVFDKTLAVNARGTMLVLRAVSATMAQQEPRTHQSSRHPESTRSLGRGSIVTIASVNGNVAAPGMMAYSASNYAAIGIAKTATSIERFSPLAKVIENKAPLGRAALPEEIADVAMFLCRPVASYMNGASLIVDAGLTLPALRNSL